MIIKLVSKIYRKKAGILKNKTKQKLKIVFRNTENFQKMKHKWLRNIEKRSTSLFISEIQIKTSWRFYFTPVRMVKINKTNDSSCL